MTTPGDPPRVVLAGPVAERLVPPLAQLSASGFPFVLVGGLAVMVRLGAVHRPTADVDGLFDNPDESTTQLLVDAAIARPAANGNGVLLGETQLDVIDTAPLPDDLDAVVDDPTDRLFLAAHRWAFETATAVDVVAGPVEVRVPVATPSALLATKTGALCSQRQRRRANKHLSDLLDVYQLGSLPGVLDPLASAPWHLATRLGAALGTQLSPPERAAAVLTATYRVDAARATVVFRRLLERLP